MGRAFEFRKARKMKRWSSMAKTFTRIGKDIVIAVKDGGSNPETNSKLRAIIQNAKSANMPKENIQRAIKNASEKNTENYKEIVLEGYGPHGIAVIIDCTTDNNNRTVANIRSYFNKCKGSLGTNGSVEYLFDKMCVFKIKKVEEIDDLELNLIDFGLEEIVIDEDTKDIIIYAGFDSFGDIQNELEKKEIEIISSEIEKIPKNTINISEVQRTDVENFIQMCEEDDDVQKIHHNA
ncbi:MAG: YebC/PmpR family DNA-binding transcriptional regulator [Bacteroidota bacterium]|nr:YebC/PmpR family DNA-binding transcriptional regulator [Bacteroidota bacterium]|tara:strand:+ start:1302 stop:2009 length:708 start_codon:yes stop_codon:yes gene_type:complete